MSTVTAWEAWSLPTSTMLPSCSLYPTRRSWNACTRRTSLPACLSSGEICFFGKLLSSILFLHSSAHHITWTRPRQRVGECRLVSGSSFLLSCLSPSAWCYDVVFVLSLRWLLAWKLLIRCDTFGCPSFVSAVGAFLLCFRNSRVLSQLHPVGLSLGPSSCINTLDRGFSVFSSSVITWTLAMRHFIPQKKTQF